MLDPTGKPWLLEINTTPQMGYPLIIQWALELCSDGYSLQGYLTPENIQRQVSQSFDLYFHFFQNSKILSLWNCRNIAFLQSFPRKY